MPLHKPHHHCHRGRYTRSQGHIVHCSAAPHLARQALHAGRDAAKGSAQRGRQRLDCSKAEHHRLRVPQTGVRMFGSLPVLIAQHLRLHMVAKEWCCEALHKESTGWTVSGRQVRTHQHNGKNVVQEKVKKHQHQRCKDHKANSSLCRHNLHLHPRGLPDSALQSVPLVCYTPSKIIPMHDPATAVNSCGLTVQQTGKRYETQLTSSSNVLLVYFASKAKSLPAHRAAATAVETASSHSTAALGSTSLDLHTQYATSFVNHLHRRAHQRSLTWHVTYK